MKLLDSFHDESDRCSFKMKKKKCVLCLPFFQSTNFACNRPQSEHFLLIIEMDKHIF